MSQISSECNGYKVNPCTERRRHDCPFVHRGEKARRRDPRILSQMAISCLDSKPGKCLWGDACRFAHGVFEYWLNPPNIAPAYAILAHLVREKYVFLAHNPSELRIETNYKRCDIYPALQQNLAVQQLQFCPQLCNQPGPIYNRRPCEWKCCEVNSCFRYKRLE